MKRIGKVWIDGGVVDADDARVGVFDRGFLYGDSVYEVVRTVGGRPFALGEHLDRLEGSASRIALVLPPRDLIDRAVYEVIGALGLADLYVRIVVTRGAGPIGLDPALAEHPALIAIALPLVRPDEALYRNGAEVAIVSPRRNSPGAVDPMVKSGNYLTSVIAAAEAKKKGAYEAVMCDAAGRIAEGASSNLFVVRGGRLATPPLSVGLLEGITRRHVIALARGLGFYVDEAPLWQSDLEAADEAFLTSSIRGVMPVSRAEGKPIGKGRPGPITLRLSAAYDDEMVRATTPSA